MIAAAMIYALAVSIPLAAATAVVAVLLRRNGKPERWVWAAGIVASLALPLAFLAGIPGPSLLSGGGAPMAGAPVISLPGVVAVPEGGFLAEAGPLLLLLWMGLTGFLALRTTATLRRIRRERRRWQAVRVAGEEVFVTPDLGPAVYGVLSPRIVLPRAMTDLPPEQLRLIVRHEREHIRAGDPWLLTAGMVLRIALPWHLAVLWMTSGLRSALELDCDRRVTRGREDVARYGATVLTVAALGHEAPHPLPAFTESTRFIKKRIIAMTRPTRTLGAIALGAIATVGVLAFAGACGIPLPTDVTEADEAVVPVESDAAEADGLEVEAADPTFTPFTVAPSITNRAEVVAAMESEYPPLLKDAGIGGTVGVYVYIDETGRPTDTRIDDSSGHQALDRAALNVVATMRFTPAQNRDEQVPVWIKLPITFQVK